MYKSRSLYDKIAESNLEKYGEIHISKNEIYRKRFEVSNHNNYIKYIGDGVSLFSCDCGENHEFEIDIQIFSKRKQGKYLCTICYPIESSKSISESDLYNYISSIYRGEIIQSYRDIMEIDIYLPEIKIGFEFNGVYWHSEKYKDKNYHSNKSFHFQEREIRIIHIWEDDWIDRKEIIKSQIKNWIGITENKLFARNCEVRKVQDIKIIKDFLNQNHIQGYTNNVLFLGLYYNDTLLSLMCFSKEEGRRNMGVNDWNLSRFCNKLNTNIVGGFSKLLNYFIKTYHPIRIISYADMGWSVGDVYYKSGFKLSSIVNPDYKYLVNGKRIHKSRFKKSKLGISGQLITESEFTKNLGISRIWDCGKMKFELFPDALKVKI